jgi:hypothetical protein
MTQPCALTDHPPRVKNVTHPASKHDLFLPRSTRFVNPAWLGGIISAHFPKIESRTHFRFSLTNNRLQHS